MDILNALGQRTLIMGILNVTPDSFADGGRFFKLTDAVTHAKQMAADGADLIDIGGESTRPGAEPVPVDEELRRVIPVIKAIRQELDIPISIDAYKAEVAEQALEAGANLVNDISALRFDEQMKEVVAKYKVPVVLMHMRGTPKTMQQNPTYKDVVKEIMAFLRERIEAAASAGIARENIIVDPGIGFGKLGWHNLEILRRLAEFRALGCPILVGTSRKAFIGQILKTEVSERLEGTIASVIISVMHGADIVRVHDVKEVKRAVEIADAIKYSQKSEGLKSKSRIEKSG